MKRKNREVTVRKVRPRNIVNIIAIAAFIFLVIAAIFYFKNILRNLDCFRVKDVLVRENSEGADDFSYLKGRNIFDIDVTGEAEYIFQAYPGYKTIKIIRVLPNRLVIDFVKRQPLAVVKLYRLFSIDEQQVLFETGNESAMTELPLISGLETKIFGPKAGSRYNIKELTQAIAIIKSIQNNRTLKNYKIKKIEINNASYLTCLISVPWVFYGNDQKESASGFEILQVRFSHEVTQDKLDFLSGLFSQIKNDLGRVSYIDLRFKEPVIKFRDDKK
jgi:cell division septal protein FtsQ